MSREPTSLRFLATLEKENKEVLIAERNEPHAEIDEKSYRDQGTQTDFVSRFLTEFDVKEILGQGGYGLVFKVLSNFDCCEYAVKRIYPKDGGMEKAMKEVRVMAGLNHPNIIRYHSMFTEEPPKGWQKKVDSDIINKSSWTDQKKTKFLMDFRYVKPTFIYIQMQLCQSSLYDWLLSNNNERDLRKMGSWFKQIVSAVEYIHIKGYIHRDLKPGNILIAQDGILKVCDLGVVTERRIEGHDDSLLYRTGNPGTKLYQSPEQETCDLQNYKTDVFTIGLILAEMCVVMTPEERGVSFNRYRHGLKVDLTIDRITEDLIISLTKKDHGDRPECADILKHKFFELINMDISETNTRETTYNHDSSREEVLQPNNREDNHSSERTTGFDNTEIGRNSPDSVRLSEMNNNNNINTYRAPYKKQWKERWERCQFIPACRYDENSCKFVHPTQDCIYFLSPEGCRSGRSCVFRHTLCPRDGFCHNQQCDHEHKGQHHPMFCNRLFFRMDIPY